jgi:hypothetical protein
MYFKFLVEHGACIFATTISDQETAAEKCVEEEEGFDNCSDYLYSMFIFYSTLVELVLLVEEIRGPGENHRPVTSH